METVRLETTDKAEFRSSLREARQQGAVEITIVTGTEGRKTEDGYTQVAYIVYPDDVDAPEAPAQEPPAEPLPDEDSEALARYQEALDAGLSDDEARELGWPAEPEAPAWPKDGTKREKYDFAKAINPELEAYDDTTVAKLDETYGTPETTPAEDFTPTPET